MANSELIQSVLKALDAVRLLSESDRPLRLSDIAAALDQKPPTVHNLLRTLRARGYVEQDSAGSYSVGPAPAELFQKSCRRKFFRKAGALLLELSDSYPQAVLTLSELTPSEIVLRLRVSPDRPGELQHPVGHIFPPFTMATSLCLQALAANAPLYESSLEHIESLEAFRNERAEIRRQQYAWKYSAGKFSAAFFVPENYAVGFSSESAEPSLLPALARRIRRLKTDLL